MTMPTPQCPWWMQVHHIHQETPDVWTLSLPRHDYYLYRVGQYALVSVCHSVETLRAYTLSSTPGVSEHITLTVRRIDEGVGSQWLTREAKRGDYLWLSDAMGELTCDDKAEDKSLLPAIGYGVTPMMPMCCWLMKYRPQADVRVIYYVRSLEDVIFAEEWCQYPVILVIEYHATHGFVAGCLIRELLRNVSDLASRTVTTCNPAPYMEKAGQDAAALDVTCFFKEKFSTPVAEAVTSGLKFTKLQPAREFYAPVDTTLLDALESNEVPATVVYRAGICGRCRTKMVFGKYSATSTMTLIDVEIADGYVLVCSCHPQSDLVLA